MDRFIARFADKIIGTLSGVDRLVFRGHLRRILYAGGMTAFLNLRRVRFKDFRQFTLDTTGRLQQLADEAVRAQGRPVRYLESSKTDKEGVARQIARDDGVTQGLVALLTCVEPCRTVSLGRNDKTGVPELRSKLGQCLHFYYDTIDPVFGFMNARIQTWFPFNIQICINGREWLARQMDTAGLGYERRDNCFARLDDFTRAQRLMDQQLRRPWVPLLNRVARTLNPLHKEICRGFPVAYYWSVYQSEWASDIVFESAAALRSIYPGLVHHAITTFSSGDVMRFLGGKVHGNFRGEIVSDFSRRPEGIRVKHWVGKNSIKLYTMIARILEFPSRFSEAVDRRLEAVGRKNSVAGFITYSLRSTAYGLRGPFGCGQRAALRQARLRAAARDDHQRSGGVQGVSSQARRSSWPEGLAAAAPGHRRPASPRRSLAGGQ